MAATGYSPSGGMGWNPYPYSRYIPNVRTKPRIEKFLGGRWQHNPYHVGWTALKGANLAASIAQGNYMTRNYRQKPLVMLQKAEHRKDPVKVLRNKIYQKIKPTEVDINTVSSRRVKNKILTKGMAYPRRIKRPKFGRRRYKRKVFRRRKLPPLALPRSKVVRMRYVVNATLSSASGAISVVPIKMNDLNDPTGALSAALPLGLDQWASQYQKYIVLGSKLIAKANQTSGTGAAVIGIHLDDDATTLSYHNQYCELPATHWKLMSGQKDLATVVMKYSGKRFWRLKDIKDDSEQEGTFSTTPGSPTDICYAHVFYQDMTGGHTATADLQLIHEFIVYLTEPVTLAQSSL